MNRKISVRLRAAARRIERGFCKGTLAVDANGDMAYPSSRRAVAWCLMGALEAEYLLPRDDSPALRILGAGIPCDFPFQIRSKLVQWNNAPETIAPEVATLLYLGAEIAAEEGR